MLIAGERRLEAMKLLGYAETEVRLMTIKDAEHQLNLEISENETRKDFSKAERIEYARRLEKIESLKAASRKEATLFGNSTVKEIFPEPEKGQTRDAVAEKLNIGSGRQYEKEKYICNHKDSLTPEDFADWDEGRLSTNKVYQICIFCYKTPKNCGISKFSPPCNSIIPRLSRLSTTSVIWRGLCNKLFSHKNYGNSPHEMSCPPTIPRFSRLSTIGVIWRNEMMKF